MKYIACNGAKPSTVAPEVSVVHEDWRLMSTAPLDYG
jgi:hypothetical protein